MDVDTTAPIHLVTGDDEILVRDAVVDLVDALVDDGDRTLMVEELDLRRYEGDDGGEPDAGPIVDAAQTPPFLTERRVVVARHAGVFSTKDRVAPVVAYLADPLPTTSLVVVWERSPRPGSSTSRVPKSLTEAVKAAGGVVVDTRVGSGRQRAAWVDDEIARSGLRLHRDARDGLVAHLGEDVDRLRATLARLEAVFGSAASPTLAEIEPYLGEVGALAPWELTDAIDRGDVAVALDRLHRLVAGGERHPLQIMATLQTHYLRMLRLDGAAARDERSAAELLGMKGSTYPARKALEQGRRLGSDRLAALVELLARADVELRGASALSDETVVEILVARLAARSRVGGRGDRR